MSFKIITLVSVRFIFSRRTAESKVLLEQVDRQKKSNSKRIKKAAEPARKRTRDEPFTHRVNRGSSMGFLLC